MRLSWQQTLVCLPVFLTSLQPHFISGSVSALSPLKEWGATCQLSRSLNILNEKIRNVPHILMKIIVTDASFSHLFQWHTSGIFCISSNDMHCGRIRGQMSWEQHYSAESVHCGEELWPVFSSAGLLSLIGEARALST